MKPEDHTKKAKDIIDMVTNGLTKADFMAAFTNVINYVKNFERAITKDFQELHQNLTTHHQNAHDELVKKVDHVFVNDRISKLEQDHHERMRKVEDSLTQIDTKAKSLKDGKNGEKGERGEKGRDGSPDTHFQIRDKLTLLKGQDRLSIGHIHGLAEALEEGKKPRIADMTAIGVNRPQVTYLDLSPSLNGVTTTFKTQSFQKVIQITLSSYPNVLQQGTDFTTAQQPPSITFIGTIAANASTILAAGQTANVLLLA